MTFLTRCALYLLLVASLVTTADSASGQNNSSKKKDEALKPRLETITTKEGVQLACGYFPSDAGKKAVPVIFIHEWEGNARQYVPLVTALRDAGCAVVSPDLRGHGESRTYVDQRGQSREFDLSKMNRSDVMAIVNRDIEAIKKFLKQENDAEKLNLNALTLIGVEEGAILAANYAALDWNFPDSGRKKQSKDVRALILISPEKNFEGIGYDSASRHPFVSRLPWQLIVGSQSSQASDADKLEKLLERGRRDGNVAGPLDLFNVNSRASGPTLVRESRDVIPRIVNFVKSNVIEKQDNFPWVSRTVD